MSRKPKYTESPKYETKLDIHLNVGDIYDSGNAKSRRMFAPPENVATYCKHYNLTHAVCIYSDYKYMEELAKLAPDTKFYGVQWITDLEHDELDQGKPLFSGIKLHSHRGGRPAKYYNRKTFPKQDKSDDLSYGIDYSHTKYIAKVLDRLNSGELVYMHTQGVGGFNNRATPRHLFYLARLYPKLKFIMGHAGGYGSMIAARPKTTNVLEEISWDKYVDHLSIFTSASIYANSMPNLWLDTSCFTHTKASALIFCTKWSIGSDYPFGSNKLGSNFDKNEFNKTYVWNYDYQERLFRRAFTKILMSSYNLKEGSETLTKAVDQLIHLSNESGVKYLDATIDTLIDTEDQRRQAAKSCPLVFSC